MEKRNPFIAWLLGWLIPGAGHLYVGRRAQGLVLLGSLGGCYVAGLLLGRGEALSAERMEFLVVQAGAGVPAALGWWLSGPAPVDLDLATRETGVLYTVAAALMNLVAALAAASIAAGRDDTIAPTSASDPSPVASTGFAGGPSDATREPDSRTTGGPDSGATGSPRPDVTGVDP